MFQRNMLAESNTEWVVRVYVCIMCLLSSCSIQCFPHSHSFVLGPSSSLPSPHISTTSFHTLFTLLSWRCRQQFSPNNDNVTSDYTVSHPRWQQSSWQPRVRNIAPLFLHICWDGLHLRVQCPWRNIIYPKWQDIWTQYQWRPGILYILGFYLCTESSTPKFG
jgi:hypothetical protein